jgi:hypothetical protein
MAGAIARKKDRSSADNICRLSREISITHNLNPSQIAHFSRHKIGHGRQISGQSVVSRLFVVIFGVNCQQIFDRPGKIS